MKAKNKHGRVGVKQSLSTAQKREAFSKGKKAGISLTEEFYFRTISLAKSLRDLKKEVGVK